MYHQYLEPMNIYYRDLIPDLLWVLALHFLPVMKNKKAIKLMCTVTEFVNAWPLEGAVLQFVAGNGPLYREQFKTLKGKKKMFCPSRFLPSLLSPLENQEDQGDPGDRGHLWVPKEKRNMDK